MMTQRVVLIESLLLLLHSLIAGFVSIGNRSFASSLEILKYQDCYTAIKCFECLVAFLFRGVCFLRCMLVFVPGSNHFERHFSVGITRREVIFFIFLWEHKCTDRTGVCFLGQGFKEQVGWRLKCDSVRVSALVLGFPMLWEGVFLGLSSQNEACTWNSIMISAFIFPDSMDWYIHIYIDVYLLYLSNICAFAPSPTNRPVQNIELTRDSHHANLWTGTYLTCCHCPKQLFRLSW
jgi:hypothetical protein